MLMGGYHEMKRIKYIKCGGRIKGRINVGLVLIGIRAVLGIAYSQVSIREKFSKFLFHKIILDLIPNLCRHHLST